MTNKLIIYSLIPLLLSFSSQAQTKVKTHEGVQIGGIKQWIGATGNDDTKPILLFLHGGPGFSSRLYSRQFIRQLKHDFIVVQWDQRGTGITKAWNSPDTPISIELMHQDTEEVVDYVLQKFDREKLYLVGFSWGGFLGLKHASKHPEKLHAYISVSAMIYSDLSDQITLKYLKNQAESSNNTEASTELNQIHLPFQTWEDLYYLRKWTAFFSSENSNSKTYPKKLFEEWSVNWMSVFKEAGATNYLTEIPSLDCPIYFFNSKRDLAANYHVAEQYHESLNAEEKYFIWFEESTHEIPSDEPKKFAEELIKIVEMN